MTDWETITEHIRNAMQAVDDAHKATNGLRDSATPEAFDQFRTQMQELTEHLTKLQTVLSHQDTYALNELADWLSATFGGKPAEYRQTPHMERTKT